MPSGSIHGPQGKFLFYCLKLNVGIQLPHPRVAPPPEDPFAGLVQDRPLLLLCPAPKPSMQQGLPDLLASPQSGQGQQGLKTAAQQGEGT